MRTVIGFITRKLGISSISLYFMIALAALMAMIVIPNLSQISEKFGFDTVRSLSVDKRALEDNVKTVSNALEETKDAKVKAEEKVVLVEKAVVATVEKKAKATTKFASNKTKYESGATGLVKASNGTASEAEIQKLSEQRIDYLWDNYTDAVAASGQTLTPSQG